MYRSKPAIVVVASAAAIALTLAACRDSAVETAADSTSASTVEPEPGGEPEGQPVPTLETDVETDVEPDPTSSTAPTPTTRADIVIEIGVSEGSVERDDTRFVVDEGSTVELIVSTDSPDHVHVHGYDILAAVDPDDPLELLFTADSRGVFEVELEDSGLFLFDLQVG